MRKCNAQFNSTTFHRFNIHILNKTNATHAFLSWVEIQPKWGIRDSSRKFHMLKLERENFFERKIKKICDVKIKCKESKMILLKLICTTRMCHFSSAPRFSANPSVLLDCISTFHYFSVVFKSFVYRGVGGIGKCLGQDASPHWFLYSFDVGLF